MSSRDSLSVARRYASALLSVGVDKNADLDRIGRELDEVSALLEGEVRLAGVLSAPTVPVAKRLSVLDAVLASAGLAPLTRNLLRLLTTKERLSLLDEIARQYRRLLLDHKQVQSGEVVSAHPLSERQQQELATSLGRALGKTMELSYGTDAELVGGLVVRIGNRVFDASVVSQLRRFKEKALSSL